MVRYPDGRCVDCGEREFARADGTQWCPNCGNVRTPAEGADLEQPSETGQRASAKQQ